MTETKLILTDLKQSLQNQFSNSVKNIILFGSQARNEATEFSDYDILILLKNKYTYQDKNKILEICYNIDLKYNIIIDAHLLSTSELSTIKGK